GVGAVTEDVRNALAGVDAVFFDGTFWSSDELPAQGLGAKRAEDMAHVTVGGAGGSLARLAGIGRAPPISLHINKTKPLARDDSTEREAVVAAGWEVAWDGMEVRL